MLQAILLDDGEKKLSLLSYLLPCHIISLVLVRGLASFKQSIDHWMSVIESFTELNHLSMEGVYSRLIAVNLDRLFPTAVT